NVVIARGTVIENAIGGSGADLMTGNDAGNMLSGRAGTDWLDGRAGRDFLVGGSGADVFAFGAAALSDAQAVTHVFDRIADYDQGNGGSYSAGEGDRIDLSALLSAPYNLGAGQPVASLVRIVASGADANLQIDPDGAANGAKWTTIAHLSGIHVGDSINLILDSSLPAGTNMTAIGQNLPAAPGFVLDAFGAANFGGGWESQNLFPRQLADVNGDGMADIVGFGYAGATVALATGGGHFAASFFALDAFGAANFGGGWSSQDQFPRALADVNGDGMTDIVGFGYAGATVALATGGGHFAAPFFSLDAFGAANFGGGWSSQDQFPRALADVNGDGMADIIGFGYAGATVALATGGGHFAAPFFSLDAFGAANFGGGWSSQDQFPRQLADVNGDGMADIVGFGNGGVTIALATGGGHFAAPSFALGAFGAANFGGGWSSQDQFPRRLADLNGDGMADIVGFGIAGMTEALATGGGSFASPVFTLSAFGNAVSAGGWASDNQYPRVLADLNG
ncbi:MAG TPA: FG-GAP-like repeat-containing protein, partial [Thermomicrobiales bacterium]|nr:FG-GAP-like repeat-containing protein [Thermomicrobiales bacterium]